MHDYHKALDMVKFAEEKAKETGKTKVSKILMSIGESSGYSADTILMYFKEVSQGTVAEGAEVVIKPVKAMLECPKCGEVFERKLMQYNCPKCAEEGQPSKIGTEITLDGIE